MVCGIGEYGVNEKLIKAVRSLYTQGVRHVYELVGRCQGAWFPISHAGSEARLCAVIVVV